MAAKNLTEINPETLKLIAMNNFKKGYNCSQSVVLAFADYLEIDETTLSKIACSFGGGLARQREICGAISGASIIMGLIFGYSSPETGLLKQNQYTRVQEICNEFKKQYSSIVCKELLKLQETEVSPIPSPRDDNFYKSRPCEQIIGNITYITANYIKINYSINK